MTRWIVFPASFCLALLLGSLGPACAACLDGAYLHWEGGLDGITGFHGIELGYPYVYRADWSLQVIDASDPRQPVVVGSAPMPANMHGLDLVGSHLYAVGFYGFAVIDVTNPAAPVVQGTLDCEYPRAVAGYGHYAYVSEAIYGAHIDVIDVADPWAPVLVREVPLAEDPAELEVHEGRLLVGSGSSLLVMDLTDPSAPSLVGSVALPAVPRGLAAQGELAYIVSNAADLEIVDITDPTAPVLIAALSHSLNVEDVWVDGDFAYVAGWIWGNGGAGPGVVRIYDVSDPTDPVWVSLVQTTSLAVCIQGLFPHVYVGDGYQGLLIVNAASREAPRKVGSVNWPSSAEDVVVMESHAFVAYGHATGHGIKVVDVTSPPAPALVGDFPTSATCGIAAMGDYLLAADGEAGLKIVDVSEPTSPVLAGSLDTPGEALGTAVLGSVAYVADGAAGLMTADVSNPAQPLPLGSVPLAGVARRVALDLPYAMVAAGAAGIHVVDVSQPASPTLVATLDTENAFDVEVRSPYLYVADGPGGLKVVDLTDRGSPALLSGIRVNTEVRDVCVAGDHAYLAVAAGAGVHAVDISDPAQPAIVASYTMNDTANGVIVSGPFVYAANGNLGLWILPPYCDATGETGVSAPGSEPAAAPALSVRPNPSSGATEIRAWLPCRAQVSCRIHDVAGRLVRVLPAAKAAGPGDFRQRWDGLDEGGSPVAPGVYFARIQVTDGTGGAVQTECARITILR